MRSSRAAAMPSCRGQRLLAVLIALWISAPAVHAQATFYEAYARGLAHEKAGRFDDARTALLRAVELRPEPGTKLRTYGLNFLDRYQPYLHLARVELELGRLDEAEGHLRQANARGVAPKRQVTVLRARLRRLRQEARREAAVPPPSPALPPAPAAGVPAAGVPAAGAPAAGAPVLEITSEPPGADMWIDGKALGSTPRSLETTAGEHLLELRLAGYRERSVTVTVRSSGTTDRHLVLEAMPPTVADSAPAEELRASPPAAGVAADPVPPPSPPPPVAAETASAPPAAVEEPAIDEGVGDSASPPAGTAGPRPGTPDRGTPAGGDRPGPRWPVWAAVAAVLVLLALMMLLTARRRSRRGRPGATASLSLSGEDLEGAPTLKMARSAPLPEGTRSDLGSYRLSGVLGVGGMARTYLATRQRDGLQVAIKVPHEHLLADDDSSERFLREGRLGATLHHPNIVRIYEAAEIDGRLFIAMELLPGETLETVLHRQGLLAVEPALGVARGIAQALDYAHLKGVVHRDLKPDNVMLLADKEVKVMDYGIARVLDAPGVTATGTYLGTPIYSSPESIRAKEIDHRSDLYSLGIILYHMLAGKVPFSSTDPLELLMMHVKEPLPPLADELGLPPAVGEIVARLTAKRPADRYPSAEILLRELDRLLNSL